MTTRSITLRTVQAEPGDVIVIPSRIRVRKEGKVSRVFCADTDAELTPISNIKVDLSNGKAARVKLTIECDLVEVVSVERDLVEVVSVERQQELFPEEQQ